MNTNMNDHDPGWTRHGDTYHEVMEESIWIIDNRTISAMSLEPYSSVFTTGVMCNNRCIAAPEMYGMLRGFDLRCVYLTFQDEDYVRVTLRTSNDELLNYIMEYDSLRLLLNRYITDTLDPGEAGNLAHLEEMERMGHEAGYITGSGLLGNSEIHNWSEDGF